jgi:hypothetical protein
MSFPCLVLAQTSNRLGCDSDLAFADACSCLFRSGIVCHSNMNIYLVVSRGKVTSHVHQLCKAYCCILGLRCLQNALI